MNYRNLIVGYVVDLILSFPTHCKFVNYGGKEDGIEELHARILKTFDIPETGHLQSCYTGKRLSMKKVTDLISELVDKDQLEHVIDLWKEICKHGDSSDLRLVGYVQEIELIGIKNGYSSNQFLQIVAPTLKFSQSDKVEEFFNSAMGYAEKAIVAKSDDGCQYYIEKLKRVLVSYPFIQVTFIAEKFGQAFLDELVDVESRAERTDLLLTKIKYEREVKVNNTKVKQMAKIMKTMHSSKKENPDMVKEEPTYKNRDLFVRFMGTEHLVQSIVVFSENEKRVDQEFSLIHGTLLSLFQEETDEGRAHLRGVIKSIIHRSFEQEKLCRDVLITPSDWEDFVKQDPRKRGMTIDELLGNIHTPKVEVKKNEDKVSSSFPAYPNLTKEEEPVSQPKVNVPGEQEESVYMELVKTVHPEVYEIIVAIEKDLGKKLQYEEVNAVLRDYVTGKPAFKRSFRYQLPEDLASKVVIKGDPADPTVQKLAAMFNLDINEVKPVTPKEPVDHHARIVKDLSDILKHYATEIPTDPETIAAINSLVEKLESRSTFKSRLTQNLDQRKTGMDQAIDAIRKDDVRATAQQLAKELEGIFLELTKIDPRKLELNLDEVCVDPSCPVHGKKKVNVIQDLLKTKRSDGESLHEHQQRIVDFLVGINPEVEGHTGFINPNGGKQRSEGSFDFSGMLKFMENYYNPEPKKPTVTEIETDSNVVINQKFVIYDAKGEFSCEYKMTWTPTTVQFRFTHDKPESERGRRFYPIRELNKPMTQDKAFAYFQSLRRAVIADGAHKPKVNPYTGY